MTDLSVKSWKKQRNEEESLNSQEGLKLGKNNAKNNGANNIFLIIFIF